MNFDELHDRVQKLKRPDKVRALQFLMDDLKTANSTNHSSKDFPSPSRQEVEGAVQKILALLYCDTDSST